MKLGEKIWRLRENQHISQEELAEKLCVSRQTVSNWENDKAVLDAEKLAKLCAVFGVSADDMLSGEGVPQPIAHNQENLSKKKRAKNKTLFVIILAIIALALIVIATVGLIISEDKVSISSLITLHSDFIWIALLIIGGVALISTIIVVFIAFLKKK